MIYTKPQQVWQWPDWKPRIKKHWSGGWTCKIYHNDWLSRYGCLGFGSTPAGAYLDWKEKFYANNR